MSSVIDANAAVMNENENLPTNETEVAKLEISSSMETLGACERRVTLAIPRSEIDRYFSKEFDTIFPSAHVPGFRPGKAPREMFERRFRKEVQDRIKSALVGDALEVFSKDETITPIGEPQFDFAHITLPESGDFSFTFDLEVRPEFDLPEWRGLEISKPAREFTEEDVDTAIREVLANRRILRAKTGGAELGDSLKAFFRFCDVETLRTFGDSGEVHLYLRNKLYFQDATIENYGEWLAGICAGEERTTTIKLAENTANEEMNGKEVVVKVLVSEVSEPEPMDETNAHRAEILESLGVGSIEELRQAMRDVLVRQLQYEQNRQVRTQILAKLTVAATWDIPPRLLRRQTERELRRVLLEMQQSGYPDEMIQQQINVLRQSARVSMTKALKEHFVLEKIGESEKVDASEDDYIREMQLIAQQRRTSMRRVQRQIEQSGEMDILRNQIVERKVIAVIVETAKVTEVAFELPRTSQNNEALDISIVQDAGNLPAASEEDLRAVGREINESKRIDPNAKP